MIMWYKDDEDDKDNKIKMRMNLKMIKKNNIKKLD